MHWNIYKFCLKNDWVQIIEMDIEKREDLARYLNINISCLWIENLYVWGCLETGTCINVELTVHFLNVLCGGHHGHGS